MSDYGIYPIIIHTFLFFLENWSENCLHDAIAHETKTAFATRQCKNHHQNKLSITLQEA